MGKKKGVEKVSKSLFESSAGYAYTNTRVCVMKSKLLKKADYDRILKMDESEIARFLGETEYKQEMNLLGAKYSGVELIEYALNKNLENSFKKIFDFAIQSSRKQIRPYFEKWDLWNTKMFLRGKLANKTDEEVMNVLVLVGKLRKEFFEQGVKQAKNLDEAVEFLKGTEYYSVIKENKQDFGKMEDALDKKYYEKMLNESESILMKIILLEVSIKNKLNFLRAKKSGLAEKEMQNFLINAGAKQLRALKKELAKVEDSPKIRIDLEKQLIKMGLKLVHSFGKNIGPIMGYFITKENEVRNLRLISRAKHCNLSEELIKQQIVI